MTTASLTPDYFEQMFAGDADPWNFETSPYEAAKYDASINALCGRHYARTLEVGCANGVLTHRLAAQCDELFAIDVSDTALIRARHRNADATHINFAKMIFPREAPDGCFDLIVLSEVVYYWSDADIMIAARWIANHVVSGGDVLLVHWTGETDYPQTGNEAVAKLRAALSDSTILIAHQHDKYRLDLWRMM